MESRALIFDLNVDIPVPVEEIFAMHQLADPQNHVDFGAALQTFEQKRSLIWEVDQVKIKKGNHVYGLKTSYEQS